MFLAALDGQLAPAPRWASHRLTDVVPLMKFTWHVLHVPADVALLPTRPLPGTHCGKSTHAALLLALLYLPAAQASHCMLELVLPVPALRPCPAAQFLQAVHVPAPLAPPQATE